MKINCISCGHKIDLEKAYNDYTGPIKCFVCNALLEIETRAGNVKTVILCSDANPLAGPVKKRIRQK